MTRADRVLIAALATTFLAAVPVAWALGGDGGGTAEISTPSGVSTVSLDEDTSLVIEGVQGDVVIVVDGGAVRVARASCPDHVCVNTGAVRAPGAVVACVPNRVVIRVGGARDHGVDAVVR